MTYSMRPYILHQPGTASSAAPLALSFRAKREISSHFVVSPTEKSKRCLATLGMTTRDTSELSP